MKRLIVFALNGALAESRMPLDAGMASLLGALNEVVKVAIISGADWPHFEHQVLTRLAPEHPRHRLTLLPACGTQLYRYSDHWGRIYTRDFSVDQRERIINAIERAIEMMNFDLGQIWGPIIEDRGSQLTYSGLGQLAPAAEKRRWDPDCQKRLRMKAFLDQFIPEYSVHLGGMTSIDVTKAGLDKGYGIRQLRDHLGIPIPDMLFVGNTFLSDGSDLAAKAAGIHTIGVRDPEQTKRVIETLMAILTLQLHPESPGPGPISIPSKKDDAAPQVLDTPAGRGGAGERHAALVREIRQTLARYAEFKDVLARYAWEKFLPDTSIIAEPFAGLADRLVSLQEAMDGCERFLLAHMQSGVARVRFIGGQDDPLEAGAASA